MIQVRSACKINLTLDVLGRRADGYHQLDSLVHTVALWDEIEIEPGGSGFTCNVALPVDNLCTRAAERWMAAQGTADFSTVRIKLRKNLPIGAGIGGGSGNAAAILLALNEHASRSGAPPLGADELLRVATTLGADVPLFLCGGAQRMRGIGEQLTRLSSHDCWIVLLKPPVFGDTHAIFKLWGERRPASGNATARLMEVWGHGVLAEIAEQLGNDLAEPARQSGQPVDKTIALLAATGATGAGLSGSGTACFGLFSEENMARDAEAKLRSAIGADWFCAAAALCPRGVQVL